VEGRFFDRHDTYLFLRDHKYWLMTHWDVLDLDRVDDYVLNRARLYCDRRDFIIHKGDTGRREDYPRHPAQGDVE